MKKDIQRFLSERAENLAFVHLTRRQDLVVNRVVPSDSSLNFLVTVTRRGVPTGRMFGVQVKANDGSVRPADLDASTGEARIGAVADAPFPLCVFVFAMDDDRGYYSWLKEPVVGSRRPALRPAKKASWGDLDGEALAQIVSAVDSWYDAQHPQAA